MTDRTPTDRVVQHAFDLGLEQLGIGRGEKGVEVGRGPARGADRVPESLAQ